MKSVYCDESGFTGNDLWLSEQPNFVYAAVAVEEDEAKEIVQSARTDYSIQAPELHTSQMLRYAKGKRAVRAVLEKILPSSSVIFFHKRYSLAGKMFEYLIEPAISDGNSMFYNIGFNKFVATGLYCALLADPANASEPLQDFQILMRTGDITRLDRLINGMSAEGVETFLGQLATVITCNRGDIESELTAVTNGDPVARWILELTTSALMSLLSFISGEQMTPLSVTCDESTPLLSQAEMLDSMIGRQDLRRIKFDNRTNQITFNLAHKIRFGNSKALAGIQLADMVASSTAFALKRPDDDFSCFWMERCKEIVHFNCVVPNVDEFDMSNERSVLNAFVLNELVDRSVGGRHLLHGMPQFIEIARQMSGQFLLESP